MRGAIIRQGDVLVERVEAIEAGAEPVKAIGGALVVALGESSGHRHQVLGAGGKNKLFRRGSTQFLEIGAKMGAVLAVTTDRGAPIVPERHDPIKLAPGSYKVTIQREYSIDREIVSVID